MAEAAGRNLQLVQAGVREVPPVFTDREIRGAAVRAAPTLSMAGEALADLYTYARETRLRPKGSGGRPMAAQGGKRSRPFGSRFRRSLLMQQPAPQIAILGLLAVDSNV